MVCSRLKCFQAVGRSVFPFVISVCMQSLPVVRVSCFVVHCRCSCAPWCFLSVFRVSDCRCFFLFIHVFSLSQIVRFSWLCCRCSCVSFCSPSVVRFFLIVVLCLFSLSRWCLFSFSCVNVVFAFSVVPDCRTVGVSVVYFRFQSPQSFVFQFPGCRTVGVSDVHFYVRGQSRPSVRVSFFFF